MNDYCHVAQQVAEHCNEYSDECSCGGKLTEVTHNFQSWIECDSCEFNNFDDGE